MCGIVGFVSPNYNEAILASLVKLLAHRGPDDSGMYTQPSDNLTLGHTRLSILDLSKGASQPFRSQDGRFVMIYNGEVYNYKELSSQLIDEGIVLRTSGDTEVILESFAIWGLDGLSKLNGMFALAIWDTYEKELTIVRDRIGIKPLYYAIDDDGQFIFGSELKIFKSIRGLKLTINQEAIEKFLHFGYIPGPFTIYNEVKKFPQGHAGVYQAGVLTISNYWSLDTAITSHQISDEKSASKSLTEILNDSVKSHLVSDVPIGTFLSGGIDSSLVTAIATKHHPNTMNTFSIGFNEAKFDESIYAERVAETLGTEHHAFHLNQEDAMGQIPNLLDIYDEPFADSSFIPTLLVSELARKKVKVVLSGDGGDELFMGYGTYSWAKRLEQPIFRIGHNLMSLVLQHGSSRAKRVAELLKYRRGDNLNSHIFSQEQYLFSKREIETLMISHHGDESLIFRLSENNDLSAMEKQALFDIQYYLPDDLLVKVDRASMHHSLEVRVPLLDHRLVEFAVNLSENIKVKNGIAKYPLKKELRKYLPQDLVDRKKWGFSVPLGQWLNQDLSYLIDEYLDQDFVIEIGLVDPKITNDLIRRFRNGEEFLYNRLWVLIVLHKFLKS